MVRVLVAALLSIPALWVGHLIGSQFSLRLPRLWHLALMALVIFAATLGAECAGIVPVPYNCDVAMLGMGIVVPWRAPSQPKSGKSKPQ